MIRYGPRGHVVSKATSFFGKFPGRKRREATQETSTGGSATSATTALWARAFEVGLPPPSEQSYAMNSTGITLTTR